MKSFAVIQNHIINLSLFLFGCLMLVVKSGYIVGPALLVLIALPFLFKKQTYCLSKEQKLVVGVLLAYFMVQVVCMLLDTHWRLRDLDLPSRSIAAILILLLLVRHKLNIQWLAIGFAVGAILSAGLAIYQKFFLGMARAFGDRMPIQSGDISMTMGLVSLCFALYYYRQKQLGLILLFSIAAVSGLLGSLLSGSRGGWVLLPVILFIFYQMHKAFLSKATRRFAAACVIALVGVCFVPQTGIPGRVMEGKQDLSLYFSGQWQGQDHSNSLGIRLILWQSAWQSFIEKPVLGWGKYGVRASQEKQLHEGRITQSMYEFDSHAHNQYLDEMAKRGTLGLLALMMIFLIPLALFRKKFHQLLDGQLQAVAASGVMVVLSTMDFCLSQAFLNHNSGVTFYFSAIAMLLGVLLNADHSTPKKQQLI